MVLDPDELRRLREELRDTDPSRRESAVRRLLAMMEASAPTVLVEALGSESAGVREQALGLLEKMAESGDPVLQQVVAAVRGVGPGA
jgi:HEAT repeat protein